MTLLCYGILLVCLLLPRFKPYSFTYAVVPLIYLLRRQGPGTQALGVLVGGILPLLAYRFPLDGLVVSAWLKVALSSIQYDFMLATFVLLVLADRTRWWKPAHDGAGRTVSVGIGV